MSLTLLLALARPELQPHDPPLRPNHGQAPLDRVGAQGLPSRVGRVALPRWRAGLPLRHRRVRVRLHRLRGHRVRWLPRVRRARLLRHPERARDELPRRCVRRPRVRRWLRAQRCEHRLRGRLDVSSRRASKVEKVEPVAGRRGVEEANEEATRRASRSGCVRFGVLFVSFPLALSSRTHYCIATRSRNVPSLHHLEESWERTYGPEQVPFFGRETRVG